MRALAHFIIQPGVRRKLAASLAPRPSFAGGHQGRADPLATRGGHHVPALQIAHSIRRAGVHNVSDRKLDETNGPAVVVQRQQHLGWLMAIAGEKTIGIPLVVFEAALRPERMAEVYPLGPVFRTRGANCYHRGA